jgi:SAM-dependent methyltransferase
MHHPAAHHQHPSTTDILAKSSTVSVPDPLFFPLNDNERLVEWLADVSQESLETVKQRLYREECSPGSNVNEEFHAMGLQPHVWSDRLIDFYGRTHAFLYESTTWNRMPFKMGMRRWIAEYLLETGTEPLDILVYGDGLGFDSLYLSQAGHRVTYFEVSAAGREFAARLFEAHNAPVTILRDADQIEEQQYDVVACLDVLEHVPEPASLVKSFHRYLKPKGRLVVNAPFYMLTPEYLTHLKCNRHYSGDLRRLYESHGFTMIDGHTTWNPLVLANCATKDLPPQSRRLRRFKIRVAGLILSSGRFWGLPLEIAACVLKRPDKTWRIGLGG